jgi:hypothetical protein
MFVAISHGLGRFTSFMDELAIVSLFAPAL